MLQKLLLIGSKFEKISLITPNNNSNMSFRVSSCSPIRLNEFDSIEESCKVISNLVLTILGILNLK